MKIGAYAEERDYSHYSKKSPKTVLAVVGTASKGPIGVPVACTSTQDLVSKFGQLRPDCYGLYAAQYFLSQSSKVYFVRAAASTASATTWSISGTQGSSNSVVALTVTALDSGSYANNYELSALLIEKSIGESYINENNRTAEVSTTVFNGVSQSSSKVIRRLVEGEELGGVTDSYNIIVKNSSGNTLETIENISLQDTINIEGSYVRINSTKDAAGVSQLDLLSITKTTEGNEGSDATAADYISAANSLKSDQLDINLIAAPGVTDTAVIAAMEAIAYARGDCLYIMDPPESLTKEGVANWRKGVSSNVTDSPIYTDHSRFNSSYAALYFDWFYIYDSVNKQKVLVPPSVVVPATIAYSDRVTDVWYAPAGLNRGIVRGVLETRTKLSKSDAELLYEDGINCIYDDPSVGPVIWGQKTLHEGTPSALDRVNVRRLLNYVKRIVLQTANYLTFEPNDRYTWDSFEMKVTPLLESIKNRRGLYEYRVVKGEDIVSTDDVDNYRMPCMIMLKPTKAAEEIPIYFVLSSTGADFNEVLENNTTSIN